MAVCQFVFQESILNSKGEVSKLFEAECSFENAKWVEKWIICASLGLLVCVEVMKINISSSVLMLEKHYSYVSKLGRTSQAIQ